MHIQLGGKFLEVVVPVIQLSFYILGDGGCVYVHRVGVWRVNSLAGVQVLRLLSPSRDARSVFLGLCI